MAAEKQKIEEGHYKRLSNGSVIAGGEHTWSLWRLPDGKYELQDHFMIDGSAGMYARLLAAPNANLAPEARRSMEQFVFPSDLSVIYGEDRRIVSLTISGAKLDGTKAEGLRCKETAARIECSGFLDTTEVDLQEPYGLFWWDSFPMLLRTWLPAPKEAAHSAISKNVMMVTYGAIPRLDSAHLTISDSSPDTLTIGDKKYQTTRSKVQFRLDDGKTLLLTVWTDAKGVILAMEYAGTPGVITALVEHKTYAEAAVSAAAKPAK